VVCRAELVKHLILSISGCYTVHSALYLVRAYNSSQPPAHMFLTQGHYIYASYLLPLRHQMCYIQTYEWACSHHLPRLLLCEEAKNSPGRRHCINPSHGFKAKPATHTICDDCHRCIYPQNGTVLVGTSGMIPAGMNPGNPSGSSWTSGLLGCQIV
jgi:hypothetical protein